MAKKKIIWKDGVPKGSHLEAHFISEEYEENRDLCLNRVFKVPQKHGLNLSTELKGQFENLIEGFYFNHTKIEKPVSSSDQRILKES